MFAGPLVTRTVRCGVCGVMAVFTDTVDEHQVRTSCAVHALAAGWRIAHWSMAMCPDCAVLGLNPWRKYRPPVREPVPDKDAWWNR